jgi:Bifunctional DNA primase/polymerase, N-terminal
MDRPVFRSSFGAPHTVPLIPAIVRGHGLHDATSDLDVIRAWWTRTPNANVGLVTDAIDTPIEVRPFMDVPSR